MKCFENSSNASHPCVLANEFRNWNSKHFIIDWEMTLTLIFFLTLRFAARSPSR